MARADTERRKPRSKTQRARDWLMGGGHTQITVTPTLAITVSLSLAVTFAISAYAFVTLVFQDTGWEVSQAQASTSYSVLMSQGVVVEENLEVQKDLRVNENIRILGSVLDMSGSNCAAEGGAPAGMVRLCFEGTDGRLKASAGGGEYVDLMASGDAEPGPPGPEGPPGPRGPAGPPGSDGLDCWDLNGDGRGARNEDTNNDGVWDARDCQGNTPSMRGVIDIPQPPPNTVRQNVPQCVEVQLSREILQSIRQDERRVNVQLTPRDQWLPLYSMVRVPSVFICVDNPVGGVVDYDIGVVP